MERVSAVESLVWNGLERAVLKRLTHQTVLHQKTALPSRVVSIYSEKTLGSLKIKWDVS